MCRRKTNLGFCFVLFGTENGGCPESYGDFALSDDENRPGRGWRSYACHGHLSVCDASMCLHSVGTLVGGESVDERVHHCSCTCKTITRLFSKLRRNVVSMSAKDFVFLVVHEGGCCRGAELSVAPWLCRASVLES